MRPETILFVIGIRVSNSKCIYYFDMAKDKFLARNCSGRKDGRGVAGGGFTARLSQHKLEAMTKSPGQKTETDQQRTELVSLSPLFQFECFLYFLRDIFYTRFLHSCAFWFWLKQEGKEEASRERTLPAQT